MNTSYKWIVATLLATLLSAPAFAAEAPPAKKATPTPKSVVAVFRIHGPIVETPVDEAFPFGGQHQPTASQGSCPPPGQSPRRPGGQGRRIVVGELFAGH